MVIWKMSAAAERGGGMIFGQQDNTGVDTSQVGGTTVLSPLTDTQSTETVDMSAQAAVDNFMNDTLSDEGSSALDQSLSSVEPQTAPAITQQPVNDDSDTTETTDSSEPVVDQPTAPMLIADTDVDVDTDNLLLLKQKALGDLGPLVDHLELTPEEKFRTTMMMIQSTDNQALIKDAYVAAQAILDDKVRAQALLDVINEINYFTQPKE